MRILDSNLLNKQLSARMQGDVQSGHIAGASALVLQQGRTVASITEGYADMEQGIPLEYEHLFRLASMTKPFVAVAALIAQEQGLFSIWDPVEKYLPRFGGLFVGELSENGELRRGARPTEALKIVHLLTHTAGFEAGPIGTRLESSIPLAKRITLSSMVDAYADVMMLDFAPGTSVMYSGRGGFDLVAAVIEVTSGLTIAAFVKKYITDPMGLKDLTFAPTAEQWGRLVRMHTVTDGIAQTTDRLAGMIFDQTPSTYFCGGAGMIGSLREYAAFGEMLRQKGVYRGVRILREGSVEQMAALPIPAGFIWGLGVRVITDICQDPYLPNGSYGWSGAYGCHFWIDPENEIVAVYMKNSDLDGGSEATTARHFEEDVYTSLQM